MRMKAKKILSILLAALLLFSPIVPVKVLAVNSLTEARLIPSGNYRISTDGDYQLSNGYKGIVTIAVTASKVKVIGSSDGKTLAGTSITIAPRLGPCELTIENLKLSASEAKSAIDFGNVTGINYDIWPYNESNADQPAPYSRTDTLLISGVCSLTGGSEGAGVRVGDGVHLIIYKAAGLSDADASLTTLGGENGPGIGGTSGFFSGSVSINGGTITATGGYNGVGLGNLTGAVTINGGEVKAISHERFCPGIGNKSLGSMWVNNTSAMQQFAENKSLILPGETIVINGGSVTASADNYPGIFAMSGIKEFSSSASLIDRNDSLGRLTINGGTITARGNYTDFTYNAAIMGCRIEINGGTVSAINEQGAGLSGISTVINDGLVFAAGNAPVDLFADFNPSKILEQGFDEINKALDEGEAPDEAIEALNQFFSLALGSLFPSSSSSNEGGGSGIVVFPSDSLTINDGIIIAQGGPDSAGIGRAGMGSSAGIYTMFGLGKIDFTPGPISINGGSIFATGGKDGAGLGGGGKIYISGSSTVIATRGGDTAQDIWAELIQDSSGSPRTYLRLEVKDKNSGKPLAGKKVTIAGVPYFSNMDGVIGCFIPRSLLKGGRYSPVKISSIALAPQNFPDAATEIIPREKSMRAVISLDFPLNNITLQGISGDNSADDKDPKLNDPTNLSGDEKDDKGPKLNDPTSLFGDGKDDKGPKLNDPTNLFGDGKVDKGPKLNDPTNLPLQLTPAFNPLQANYTLYVDNRVSSVKVTPEKVTGDTVTTVQVNGIAVEAGEAVEVPLQFGENNILVTVSLPSEEWAPEAIPMQKQYSIKVKWENMQIAPNALTINIGDTERLVVQFDDGHTGERSGTWSVGDSNIISLEESNTETIRINKRHTIPGTVGAKVTGLKPGNTTVTFTDTKTGVRRDCTVTVDPAFTITPDPLTVYEGETGSLTVAFNNDYKGSRYGRWTIDDSTIATIDQNGVVTGIKAGTAIVTYASGLAPIGTTVRNGDTVIIEATATREMSAYDVVKTVSVVVKPEICTVTFDSNGGSPTPSSVTVKHDTTVARPSDPSFSGKKFQGWYTVESGGSKWDFENDKVTDDMTLYAQWREDELPSTPLYKAPTITGPDTINLLEGYDSTDQVYTFGGRPVPTYGTEATTADAIFVGNTLTIPEGHETGSYEVTLYATNSVGTTTKIVTVNVYPIITINFSTDIQYNMSAEENRIIAFDGAGGPYIFTLAPGSSMPDGLTLHSDGTITGTTEPGIHDPVSVVISDSVGNSITKTLPVNVTD